MIQIGCFQGSSGEGGIPAALESAAEKGANVVQVFLSSPMSPKLRKIENPARIQARARELGISIYVHSPYTINLAKPPGEVDPQIAYMVSELGLASAIGAKGCILHVGKSLDRSPETSHEFFVDAVRRIISSPVGEARLFLETAAGQGTEMYRDIRDFCTLLKSFGPQEKERLGICADTCHVFAAGHTARECIREILLLPIELHRCIHLNGSKKPRGSRVDRHEELDRGFLPKEEITEWISFAREHGIPMILETPDEGRYAEYIEAIKRGNSIP
jgi:deoxyribonuclease-4